jgi:hypothetical protein
MKVIYSKHGTRFASDSNATRSSSRISGLDAVSNSNPIYLQIVNCAECVCCYVLQLDASMFDSHLKKKVVYRQSKS